MGGGWLKNAYGDKGVAEHRKKLYGRPGDVNVNTKGGYKQEVLIGQDSRAIIERHHSDHDSPKKHTAIHDHKITWDENGDPQYSKPINYNTGNAPKLKEEK